MANDLSLFSIGYKTEPVVENPEDPKSWLGWRVRLDYNVEGLTPAIVEGIITNAYIKHCRDARYEVNKDLVCVEADWKGDARFTRGGYFVGFPGLTFTPIEYVGLTEKTASDAYFDSTPSEAMTPEEQIGGLNPIPEEKLRRTNPKRYDQRTDWYSGINEHGHDAPMQNKYDDAPALSASLKFGYKIEPESYHHKKEFSNRVEYYNEHNQLHRTDGPAIEYPNGYKEWWINGQRHRTDGPAVEYSNGSKEWYLNGQILTEEEFNQQRRHNASLKLSYKIEPLKIGDKVVPISKSNWDSLEESKHYQDMLRLNKKYLVINKIEKHYGGVVYICGVENSPRGRGDFFLENDLILYNETEASLKFSYRTEPEYYPGSEFKDRVKVGDVIKYFDKDLPEDKWFTIGKVYKLDEDRIHFWLDPWWYFDGDGDISSKNTRGIFDYSDVEKFQFSSFPTTASLKFSESDLPDGESYPDYYSGTDIQPDESVQHSPTVRKEKKDIVKYRYDTGNEEKFFEKGMHQDFDRKELGRSVTPFGSLKKASPETRIFDKKEYVDVTGTGASGSMGAAFGMIRRENKTWIPAKSYKEYMELMECIKKDLEKDSSLLQEIDWEIDSLVESSQIMKTASIGKDDFIKKLIIRSELHDPTPVTVEKAVDNLFEALEKEYVEPFEKRLDEKGEDILVLWGDGFKPQQKRFMDLAKIGDLEGKSILDIGSGYGDLLDFIKKVGIKISDYKGIDFSDRMVEIAQKKHPEYEFERRNIRLDPLEEESYDYVFGSGIFFLKHPDWKKYVHEVVESMFRTARIGVAVNFLMDEGKNAGDLNYVNPDEVKEVLRSITHKLDIYEDKSIGDFTVYLFKDKKTSSLLKFGYKIEPESYHHKEEFGDRVEYYNEHNQLHRTDGPAIEWSNGDKEWYLNGQRHRTDGPAVEYSDGTKSWYLNGQLHRTDGPAVEYSDGTKSWYLNGQRLTEEEFNQQRRHNASLLKFGYKTEPEQFHVNDWVKIKSKSVYPDPLHDDWVGKKGRICRVMLNGIDGSGGDVVYEVDIDNGYRRYFLLRDLDRVERRTASLKFAAADIPIGGTPPPTEPPQPPQVPPAVPPESGKPPKKKGVKKEQQGKSTKPVIPQVPAGDAPLNWVTLKKTNEEEYKRQLDEQIDQLTIEGFELIPQMIYSHLDESKSSIYRDPVFLRGMIRRDFIDAGYFPEAVQTAFNLLKVDDTIEELLDEEFGWNEEGWEKGKPYGQNPADWRGDYWNRGDYYHGGESQYKYEPPKIDIEKAAKEVGDWLLKYFDHEVFTLKRLKYLVDKYFPNFYQYRREDEAIINALPAYNAEEFKIEGTTITVGKPPQPGEGEVSVPPNIEMNMDELKQISLSSIEEFAPYGEKLDTKDGMYVFIDNGSDILAVAHLDTVQDIRHFDVNEGESGKVIKNAQLDDRLGAYIILKLLPQLGVKADILLTEGEEVGKSTAKHFLTQKNYNWIFQFDRQGIDTVMYQYEDVDTKKLMEKYKFMVGKGSVSDISYLEKLGIKAFNFGTGYYDNHSVDAYAVESDIKHNIKLFLKFYNDMKDTKLEHKVPEKAKPKKQDDSRMVPSLRYEEPKVMEMPFKVGDKVKFTNPKKSLKGLVDKQKMKVFSDPDLIGEVVSVRNRTDYDELTETVKDAGVTIRLPDDSEWDIPLSSWKEHIKKAEEGTEKEQPEELKVGDRVKHKKRGEVGTVLQVGTGNRGKTDGIEIKYPSGKFVIPIKNWKKYVDKIGESEESDSSVEFKVGDKVRRKSNGEIGEVTKIDTTTNQLHIKYSQGTYIIPKGEWSMYVERVEELKVRSESDLKEGDRVKHKTRGDIGTVIWIDEVNQTLGYKDHKSGAIKGGSIKSFEKTEEPKKDKSDEMFPTASYDLQITDMDLSFV